MSIWAAALIILGSIIIMVIMYLILPYEKETEKYVGPFPRMVKARRAYGWQLVDAKILGTRRRFFLTRYVATYTFRNDFLGRCEVTRYIRKSQIMKV